MNPQARFVKTDKGHDEIKNRTHKLEARTRQLLVMVDGGKAAADLLQTAKGFGGGHELLLSLLKDGFIREAADGEQPCRPCCPPVPMSDDEREKLYADQGGDAPLRQDGGASSSRRSTSWSTRSRRPATSPLRCVENQDGLRRQRLRRGVRQLEQGNLRRRPVVSAACGCCLRSPRPFSLRPAGAELRGIVQEVVNPESPRAEWRRQPVAGAYVAMTWSVVVPAPAHATESCRHAEIARTDASGQYVIQGPSFITAGLAKPRVLAYLPGREQIAFPYPGSLSSPADITLGKPARSADDRLQMLLMLETPGCTAWRSATRNEY